MAGELVLLCLETLTFAPLLKKLLDEIMAGFEKVRCLLAVAVLGLSVPTYGSGEPFASKPEASKPLMQSKSLPSRLAKLEFNGYMKLGGTVRLSFYDPVAEQSHWIAVDSKSGDFSVDQFDPVAKHVRVSFQGFSRFIYLSKEQIEEMKAVPMKPPASGDDPLNVVVDTRDPETIREESEAAEMLGFDMAVAHEIQQQRKKEHEEELRKRRARLSAERRVRAVN